MKHTFNIILLGDLASGKATQAKMLVKKYGLFDLDTGRLLREGRVSNAKLDATLKRTYDKGKLTPTSLIRAIYRDTIPHVNAAHGILFDGNPKMLGEAELVARLLKKAGRTLVLGIYLSIPLEEAIRRASQRKEYIRGQWSKRPDDTRAAIRNRRAYYRKNVAQSVAFFKNHYPFYTISGVGSPAEVAARIKTRIKEFLHETLDKNTARDRSSRRRR